MLSYLKEGQKESLETPEALDETNGSLSKQDDYLTVSGHGQKLRQSTILLIAVFGVGVLGVWFMIKKTTPVQAAAAAAAKDDQAQLENAIAQLNGMQTEMNSKMDSVIGRFNQSSSIGQIGVDELKKNPFKLEVGSELVGTDETQQKMLLEDKVRRLAAGLQLWSVNATPRGVSCMINDKVLYVGDTLGELTVKNIDEKSVELEHGGISVQLKIDE